MELTNILVLAGVLNLAYGFLTGFAYAKERMSKEWVSRYLQAAHIGPLLQGIMLLSLTIAFQVASLSETMQSISIWLLVASSIFIALKDTVNWLMSIKDEFQEKPILGKSLGTIGVLTGFIGLGILIYGVFKGIF